jgi:hypothetical protein
MGILVSRLVAAPGLSIINHRRPVVWFLLIYLPSVRMGRCLHGLSHLLLHFSFHMLDVWRAD